MKNIILTSCPIICAGVIAVILNRLKHTYTEGFAHTISLYSVSSIVYASFRNYHILLVVLIGSVLLKLIKINYWAFTFFAGFFAYAFIISLWGTSDTFLYLHIPALPLFALGVGALVDEKFAKQEFKFTAVLFFISLALFIQTMRGGIRSYMFNQESDFISQMLTTFKPVMSDNKLWTNCDEASGTIIRYSELMYGRSAQGVLSKEPRWMYRLFETKQNQFPKQHDWIVESKKCFPHDISSYSIQKIYSGTFYNIYEVN